MMLLITEHLKLLKNTRNPVSFSTKKRRFPSYFATHTHLKAVLFLDKKRFKDVVWHFRYKGWKRISGIPNVRNPSLLTHPKSRERRGHIIISPSTWEAYCLCTGHMSIVRLSVYHTSFMFNNCIPFQQMPSNLKGWLPLLSLRDVFLSNIKGQGHKNL